jgi:molybdopterin-guanine dinucleotide biosynthesis protein
LSLEQILEKCKGIDVVLIEGFRNILQKNEKIPKIVSVKSAEEALEALKTFNPIIAFTGPHRPEGLNLNVPYIDVLKDENLIVDVVENAINKSRA